MGVLQRFERRLGGLVEGAFAKVFKGDVQPVEIAQALQREADDRRQVVGQGKVLAPNDYVVELSEHDYTRLESWQAELTRELAEMVREHGATEGYSFVGKTAVHFERAAGLDTGVFRVRSGVDAGSKPDGGTFVHAGDAASDVAAADAKRSAFPGNPRLVVAAGGKASTNSAEARGEELTYPLEKPVTVIGRASTDVNLRIDDPGISRRHAEIRLQDDAFVLTDLGSTNGVRVNGTPVTRRELIDGDRVELGSSTLLFRYDETAG